MKIFVLKILFISTFFCSQRRCYPVHWFYPYRSFIHSTWWSYKLGHREYL